MIDGVQLKICGLTSLVDAEAADNCGADFLGFILYPGSPRCVQLNQYAAMAERLPPRRRVAVLVEPTGEELARAEAAGFDRFQIHFGLETAETGVKTWSDEVSPDRLWLAPKLPPGTQLPVWLLPLAKTFLLDGYRADQFGGTGRTSDWEQYRRLRRENSDKTWVLSGGLGPDNIAEALARTEARFVDVNSGVESSPGIKDLNKLKSLVAALHKARTQANL